MTKWIELQQHWLVTNKSEGVEAHSDEALEINICNTSEGEQANSDEPASKNYDDKYTDSHLPESETNESDEISLGGSYLRIFEHWSKWVSWTYKWMSWT